MAYFYHIILFIIIIILTIIYLVFESIKENLNIKPYYNIINKNKLDNKHMFELIDVYINTKLKNQNALTDLLDKQNDFKIHFEENIEENKKIISYLSDYIKLQNEECHNLLKTRNECELIFEELKKIAMETNDYFTSFQQILNNTNTSFEYWENSETLINDLRYSFHALYTVNSETVMKEIDGIIANLNNIAFKCAGFQEFIKPIYQYIGYYSKKIETTLNLLYEKDNKNTPNDELIKEFKEISDKITNYEAKIKDLFSVNELFINKNNLILTKISEIYTKDNILNKEDKDKDSKSSISQKDSMTINDSKKLEKKLKKTKAGLIVTIILGILISIIAMYRYYDEMKKLNEKYSAINLQFNESNEQSNDLKTQYDELKKQYDNTRIQNREINSKYNNLLKDYENSKNIWKFEITSITFGNWNYSWIDEPGTTLISARMGYLKPVIIYNSSVNEDVTFYIKIIKPNGQLENNSNSPFDFTYTYTTQIYRGSDQSLYIGDWGRSDQSIFGAGIWTFEIWYNNVCLKSEKVRIES